MQDPSNESRVLNRTWTISSHPSEQTASDAFSITVKRVGLISAWLHSSFGHGGILQWRGIGGDFTPQAHSGPALLIAGGIGEGSYPTAGHHERALGRQRLQRDLERAWRRA